MAHARQRRNAAPPPSDAGVDAGSDAGTDAGVDVPDAGPLPGIDVDASDAEAWVYFSLRTGEVVTPSDAASSDEWDLALQRTLIATNSGTTAGGVAGAKVAELSYDELSETSTFDFEPDAMVESARPGVEPSSQNPVLTDWYDYNVMTHALTPKANAFVVRDAVGGYHRVQIHGWAEGVFRLEFGPIETVVSDVRVLEFSSPDAMAWQHIDVERGVVGTLAEAAPEDELWDVRAAGTNWGSDSGTSGDGMAGALFVEGATLATLVGDEVAADAFVVDTLIEPARPGASAYDGNEALSAWYDYDFMTHVVSPRVGVFMLRTRGGHLAALAIESYAAGDYRISLRYAGPNRSAF